MGIGWNQISMEGLERPQQLNKKLSGSILSGVRQSTKTINVSTAVCVSQRATTGIVFAPLLDRRCWLKRQRGLITGAHHPATRFQHSPPEDAQLVGGIMWILQGSGKEFQYSVIECNSLAFRFSPAAF